MNLEKITESYIQSNGDDSWVKFDDYKSSVREKYIETMEEHEPNKDSEQSWRSVSGEFLEIFVEKYLQKELDKTGNFVSRESGTPQGVLDELKIDFNGESKRPDTDLIYHDKKQPLAVISCKSSIRERVSQTLFWKMKLDESRSNISFFFVSTDTDDELTRGRKWRPILVDVMDGVYVLDDGGKIGDGIKMFSELPKDLEKITIIK